MRLRVALVFVGCLFAACGGTITPPAQSDGADVLNTPPGGEYAGLGYLITDTCNSRNPDNPADADYFKPLPINPRLYPLNADQTSFIVTLGTVLFNDVMPAATMVDNHWRYTLNHEVDEPDISTFNVTKLLGTIESGVFFAALSFGQYDGKQDHPGEVLCEIHYELRAMKVKNYQYTRQ